MTDTTAVETTGDLFGLTPGNRAAGLSGLLPGRTANPDAPAPAPPGPFEAVPLRRDQVTGTPAERLAIVEAALRTAKLTEMESVRAARVRGRIEAGAALEFLVQDELHKEAGYSSLDDYATNVLHMDRTAVYEYIKDSKRLALVAPLSKAANRPLLPAQAKVLAPIVEQHGQDAARRVLEKAEGESGKVTAASLKAAAQQLDVAAAVEKTPAPPRPALSPLDQLEVGLKALRNARAALDVTNFQAALADGSEVDTERLRQLRADVSAETRAIGAAAAWRPKQGE